MRSVCGKLRGIAVFLFCTSCTVVVLAQDTTSLLQEKIEHLTSDMFRRNGEDVYKPELVISFYQSGNYQLAWRNKTNAAMLLALLQCATDEGLIPQHYHFTTLRNFYDQHYLAEDDKVVFDILLTDAFMLYASHLLTGKVDPTILYSGEWIPTKRSADLVSALQTALEENGLVKTIEELLPENSAYKKLKQALLYYRSKQNEVWISAVPHGKSIEPGMRDNRIPLIRERMAKDLLMCDEADSTYDSVLVEHVKRFQRQCGLQDDGVIGKYTIEMFNQPIQFYIEKIIVNLERYRWLPDSLGEKYVVINIPAYELAVMEQDSCRMKMKVIVGRPDRRTPVFSNDIHYLILNPTWTVPPTILREDALPAIKKDIHYLERNNIRLFNRAGEEVDPWLLPWATYTERNFPYQLRQDPGPTNSLGLIKFQLTNNFRVFLHDTNHRGLFMQSNRALSSGCIRIEHPFWLAQYLLTETSWTQKKIDKVIASGKTTTIVFPKPAFVQVQYFTAFVNEAGELQLRNDIYSWDDPLLKALLREPRP